MWRVTVPWMALVKVRLLGMIHRPYMVNVMVMVMMTVTLVRNVMMMGMMRSLPIIMETVCSVTVRVTVKRHSAGSSRSRYCSRWTHSRGRL